MAADGDFHHLCKLMAPVRHRWSINDVIGGIRNTLMPSDCTPFSQTLKAQFLNLHTGQEITKLGQTVLPHPPHSSDLAPSDFHLFGGQKDERSDVTMMGRSGVQIWLKGRPAEWCRDRMQRLPSRWHKDIDFNGDYAKKNRQK
ncbi:hypothetical protein ANN_15457 [Periplaneta americana]|uniref:Uncharacterized protein n=1 Tax=Periplaneta americana TaxID=6978 RepID=A0ABQ8SIB9_PERAM|nr:hypothetical protein ANN_15457 [Periplaneta americana]